jgi:hypothetical protein
VTMILEILVGVMVVVLVHVWMLMSNFPFI